MTIRGTSGTLQPGTTQLTGSVNPNVAPVLAKGGTINNLYATAALSPGVIAAMFGSGMASQTASPTSLPLPTSFNATQVLIGGSPRPSTSPARDS